MLSNLLENWHLKLLALVFAVILWLFIVGEQKQERGYVIPLVLKNTPEGLVVANDIPSSVDVRIVGPRTLLASLGSADLSIVLDLAGLGEGITTFRRLEDRVNLPGGLRVSRLTPSAIEVALDRRVRRDVAVKAVVEGVPARGFRLRQTTVHPSTVVLEGAAGELQKVSQILTEPLSIAGATAPVKATPSLIYAGKYSRIVGNARVDVTIEIEPESRAPARKRP